MKKYKYLTQYNLKDIIPLEETKAAVDNIETKWRLKLVLILLSALLLLVLSLILLGVLFVISTNKLHMLWILLPFGVGGIFFITWIVLHLQLIKEIKQLPLVQEIINTDSTVYYNHLVQQMPQLQGIKITSATNERVKTLNPEFLQQLKKFSLAANQVLGGHLNFTYQDQEFIWTNELVGERQEPIYDKDGKIQGYEVYYTFVSALLSAELLPKSDEIYYFNRKKLALKPAGFKKFESESVLFNQNLNTFYKGDDVFIFNKFNPAVIDKFNQTNLTKLKHTYGNASGVVTYSVAEVSENFEISLNSIFGIKLFGKNFMTELDKTMQRFENNLNLLFEKFSYILPFYL